MELIVLGAHDLRSVALEELLEFDHMKEPAYLVWDEGLAHRVGRQEKILPAKFRIHANQYWVNTDGVKRFVVAMKAIGFKPVCELEGPDHSFKYIFEFWFDISTPKVQAYYSIGTGSRGDVLPAIYTRHLNDNIIAKAKVIDHMLHRVMRKAQNHTCKQPERRE